jgi:hypothetical protein
MHRFFMVEQKWYLLQLFFFWNSHGLVAKWKDEVILAGFT